MSHSKVFLIAGVIIPVLLHVIAPQSMPWWPDTVSMGVVFGVTALLVTVKFRKDRENNRRLWRALKTFIRFQ